METKIKKWGNSLGIRIPKSILKKAVMHDGSLVELEIKRGVIIVKKQSLSYDLNSLLSKITAGNKHKEISTGKPTGREIW